MSPASARALFAHPPFLFYFAARGLSKFCFQIGAVAVGWQVYALTNSAVRSRSWSGLCNSFPPRSWCLPPAMSPTATIGKRVAQISQLPRRSRRRSWPGAASPVGSPSREIFAAVARVRQPPLRLKARRRRRSCPASSPEGMLQRAAALSTGAFQMASIGGPALGGLIYARGARHALCADGRALVRGRAA